MEEAVSAEDNPPSRERPPQLENGGANAQVGPTLTKFFDMLDRLLTVARVYPRHHPVIDGIARRCVDHLSGLLESVGPVSVELTPTELLSESGDVVYSREMNEKERFVWYNPHSDGLRKITFKPTLDAEELLQFMGVVEQSAADAITSDDDTITLLWEAHLVTIAYRSLDAFVDSETLEEFNERTPKEMVDLVVDAAIEPEGTAGRELESMFQHVGIEGLDWFTSQRLRSTLVRGADPVDPQHLEYALSLGTEQLDRLYEEWHSGNDLEFRFVEALLSIIRTSPKSEAAEHVQAIIEKMTLEMIDKEMYDGARRVLELLKSRQDIFEEADNPLEAILEEVSRPEIVEALLWRMQKSDEYRPQLLALLKVLRCDVVERRCLAMLAADDELPSPTSLVDLLFQLSRDAEQVAGLDEALLDEEIFLSRMLAQFAHRDLAAWPPAKEVMGAALRSEDHELIVQTLELDAPWWSDRQIAQESLLPLVEHSDEQIRRRAYRHLALHQPRLFAERIRHMVADKDFRGKSIGELRFLFRTFVDHTDGSCEDLYPCLETSRGWLGGARREAAKAAAQVLTKRGDAEAIELVRSRTNSLWTAPRFKTSLSQILKANEADGQKGRTDDGGREADAAPGGREESRREDDSSTSSSGQFGAEPAIDMPSSDHFSEPD